MAKDLFSQVIDIIAGLTGLTPPPPKPPEEPASEVLKTANIPQQNEIDWANPEDHVTEHFTVKDCLMLHKWNRLANKDDGADLDFLVALCNKMEEVRKILNVPINVHCTYRSPQYNKEIGANPNDPHSRSNACDFDCLPHLTCDQVKEILLPKIEGLGMRMENNGKGATWVHLDVEKVIHNRFFNP